MPSKLVLVSGHAQFDKLIEGRGEVLVKALLVRGIDVDPLSPGLLKHGHIGWQHHQLAILIGELFGPIPVTLSPVLSGKLNKASYLVGANA